MRCFLSTEPGEGELEIDVLLSGVSPGTERRCFQGKQAGAPVEGFIPGYQCLGRVRQSRHPDFTIGDRVFLHGTRYAPFPRMWGGHVSQALVAGDQVYPVPDQAPESTAVFAKLAAIAHHGIRMAAPEAHEAICVVGLGPIGFFAALILKALGHDPRCWDLAAERVDLARSAGLSATWVDPDRPLASQISSNASPDILIDATGVPSLLNSLIQSAAELPWGGETSRGMRLVLQGSYPGDVVFDYDTAFTRELSLLVPRDHTPDDVRAVLSMMGEGRLILPPDAIRIAPPDDAQNVYETLGGTLPLSTAFRWNA